jgi:peptidoglycan/LPS O-acetylase OafA/YrhL
MQFYGLIHEQTALRRWLGTPMMDLLGKCSYVFYLIHLGVIDNFLRLYPYTSPALVRLAIYITLSILLYKFVENPINDGIRYLNRTFFRPAKSAVPQSA